MSRRDTRELILATSLSLFNRLGEPNVTTNLIADEAGISPGNLYYHFRHKQDIVQDLFNRFAHDLVPLIDFSPDTRVDAEHLWFRLHLVFELKGQYRFIYRNISDIAGRMPDIEKAVRGLFVREQRAVKALLEGLGSAGILQSDSRQQAMLRDQFMLTLTYWIPYADLFDPHGAEDGNAQVRAIARVFLLALPYLREPWREQTETLAAAYLAKVGPA